MVVKTRWKQNQYNHKQKMGWMFGSYIWVYKQFLLEIVITCSIYILNINKLHYRASASAFPRPKRRRRGGRSSSSSSWSSIAMGHGRPKKNSPAPPVEWRFLLGISLKGHFFWRGWNAWRSWVQVRLECQKRNWCDHEIAFGGSCIVSMYVNLIILDLPEILGKRR